MAILRDYLDKLRNGNATSDVMSRATPMVQKATTGATILPKIETPALPSAISSITSGPASDFIGDNPLVQGRLSKNTDTNIPFEPAEIATKGVDEEQAEQLFQRSLERDQKAVKDTLKSVGVTTVPQRVFDGLVSFYQNTGDITYVYYDEEKIDLTGLYASGEWERVSKFIGRDQRNSWRRNKDVAAMLYGDYGKVDDNKTIIKRGLDDAVGLIKKGKFNYAAGNPASLEQTLAVGSSYFRNTGNMMPGLDYSAKSGILDNLKTNKITDLLKQSSKQLKY